MTGNYNNDSENWNFLPEKAKENPFAVPPDYFELLSDRIIAKIELKEELEGFSELSRINKKIAFAVPEDYFNSNENALEYQFELASFSQLEKIKAHLKNAEQAEYFESLDQKLVNKIEITDELKEYTLLQKLSKENNFEVSPEYFDGVADRVKERKYSETNQVSWIERLLRFILKPQVAIAYSVILIVAIGLTVYYSGEKTISGDCKTLACLEKNELLNEQNMSDFDEEHLYDEVDLELLDKQISGEESVSNEKNTDSILKNKE